MEHNLFDAVGMAAVVVHQGRVIYRGVACIDIIEHTVIRGCYGSYGIKVPMPHYPGHINYCDLPAPFFKPLD